MAKEPRELKQLLGSLRQQHSAAWLYGVLERQEDAVLIVDMGWRLRFYNPSAGKLLLPAENIQAGLHFRAVGRYFTPSELYLKGEPGDYEFQLTETEWEGEPAILIKLKPVGGNGEPVAQ